MKSVITSRALQALVHALIPRARAARLLLAVAFVGFFTAACGDSTGTRTAATVTISPTTASVPVGTTQQFTAVVKDSKGNVLNVTPTWSVTGGGSITATGLFTAPLTPGTSTVSVQCSGIIATATVTVVAGPAASIAVTPQTVTMFPNATQTFTAVVKDAQGNVITTLTPVWTVPNPPGTVVANAGGLTAVFTAGNTLGSYPNSVSACVNGTICDQADVIIVSPPPPPPPASTFTILANAAVTCTNGGVTGDVGTFRAAGDVPPGSITQSTCPITGGTPQVGTPAAKTAFNNFVTQYTTLASSPCGVILTGTLAGQNLPPGVYCFTAGASPTGTLTLTGTATDRWLFKIGTGGTGGLTPGLFTVVMAGGSQACNVTWWVQQAASITDSQFNGSVLAGAGVTLTRGSFHGNAWGQADVTVTGPLASPVTGCP